MAATSTADSKDGQNGKTEPATDPAVTGDGATHSAVEGEVSPRLPHEHDESSDSGTRPPDPMIEQAGADVESGKQPTDRGETTDEVYQRTLRSSTTGPRR